VWPVGRVGLEPTTGGYEKPGPTLRTHYLHAYHGFAPLKAVISPFARVTRSTNRSAVTALASVHRVTVRNIAKERRAYVRGERRHSLPRLDARTECDQAVTVHRERYEFQARLLRGPLASAPTSDLRNPAAGEWESRSRKTGKKVMESGKPGSIKVCMRF